MGEQLNWKRLLLLGGALLVLGGLTFWFEGYHAPAQEKREEAAKKPFPLEDQQIESVRLMSGGTKYEFKCVDIDKGFCKPRDTSNWELVEPMKGSADRSAVSTLLTALNGIMPVETLDLSTDSPEKRAGLLRDYKLDPQSRATGWIEVVVREGEKTRTLTGYVGDKHAITSNVYLGLAKDGTFADEKIYIVSPQIKSYLSYDLGHWRNKKIFSFGPTEVQALAYEGPDREGKIFLTRSDKQWTVARVNERTVGYPGDAENIEGLLSAALFLNAKSFAAENKNEGKKVLSGARKVVEMGFHRQGQKKLTSLSLYEKKSGKETLVYAVNSDMDPVYEVTADTLKRLSKTLKDFRLQKLLTSQERFQAKKIDFHSPDVAFALVKSDSDWKLESDPKKAVDQSLVMKLFDQLTGNHVKRFLKKAPAGEKQGLRVTVSDGGDGKHELLFWKSQGKLYARDLKGEIKETLELDASVGEALPWKADYFEKTPEAEAEGHGHDH